MIKNDIIMDMYVSSDSEDGSDEDGSDDNGSDEK